MPVLLNRCQSGQCIWLPLIIGIGMTLVGTFAAVIAALRTIATDLREPAGVAFRDGSLYVSAVRRIVRFDDIERRLDNPPQPVLVSDKFPTDGQQGHRFIAFGPDAKLYAAVGAPCNICAPDPDPTRTSCE